MSVTTFYCIIYILFIVIIMIYFLLQVPEFETYFFIELYDVSAGALINGSTRFAKIIIIESDSPRGLIFFAVGSRVAVAHKKTTLISLQIFRQPSSSQSISLEYILMVSLNNLL